MHVVNHVPVAAREQRPHCHQKDIIAGRKPISAYKEELSKWRSGGGDKMRAEFEASLAGK